MSELRLPRPCAALLTQHGVLKGIVDLALSGQYRHVGSFIGNGEIGSQRDLRPVNQYLLEVAVSSRSDRNGPGCDVTLGVLKTTERY